MPVPKRNAPVLFLIPLAHLTHTPPQREPRRELFPISPTSESRQLALDLIVWQPPRYPATFYRPSSRPTSTTAWLCSSNKRLAQRVSTVISLPANGSGTCRTAHRISTAQGTTSVSHRFWTDHCRPSLPLKDAPKQPTRPRPKRGKRQRVPPRAELCTPLLQEFMLVHHCRPAQ